MGKPRSILAMRLRSERLAQHLTPGQLAARAGYSQNYINALERDARSMSLDALERLAAALGIPAWMFLKPEPGESGFNGDEEETLRRLDEALELEAKPADGYVPRSVAVYSYYDEQDIPLYIGVAANVKSRQRSHVVGSAWMEFAARSVISRYSSRTEALKAEGVAIRAERPLFNVQHNNTVGARLRLIKYLTEHERTDLIPLIRWPAAVRQVRAGAGFSEIPAA